MWGQNWNCHEKGKAVGCAELGMCPWMELLEVESARKARNREVQGCGLNAAATQAWRNTENRWPLVREKELRLWTGVPTLVPCIGA